MKENKIKELIAEYLKGDLEKSKRLDLENNLNEIGFDLEGLNDLEKIYQQIGEIPIPETSKQMDEKFYSMLENEKKINEVNAIQLRSLQENETPKINRGFSIWQIAAGFTLLVFGVAIGLMINSGNGNNSEVALLKNEILEMKQMVMLNKLNEPSASQRVLAVSYINEFTEPDPKIIEALVKTMNNDENSSVRLAALSALSKYSDNENVRDSLIESLKNQTDPLLQISLINLMMEIQDRRAIDPIKNIYNGENTLEAVKQQAKKGLEVII
ncbi:MAG: HEAT repeat domain-containing protein [Bacteroidales bacterium]|nr:HEAT repeat domain-containing protein [Bacteroidales bacterium]